MMNSKIIPCLALVLGGVLTGCSSIPPDAGPKVFDYLTLENTSPETEPLEILGGRLSIRIEADSWSSLIKNVNPTFAWNGRDMMWIETDTNGQPKFVLDEAYVYQPANQPRRWVLLDEHDALFDPGYEAVMGRNLHGVATLHATAPIPYDDAGDIGDYAVVKSTDPRFGAVYEIGWQRLMAGGTAHPTYNRRIYVLQDRKGLWHFLGEGPEEGSYHGGGNTVESRVIWMKARTQEPSLQIQFVCRKIESEAIEENPDFVPCPDFETYDEWVLMGTFPAPLRRTTSRSHLLAGNGDTLDKIAALCAAWMPIYIDRPNRSEEVSKERSLELWRAELGQLNVRLNQTGEIREGTRIEIPTYKEMHDWIANVSPPAALNGRFRP